VGVEPGLGETEAGPEGDGDGDPDGDGAPAGELCE
jgi:hypothetical protein